MARSSGARSRLARRLVVVAGLAVLPACWGHDNPSSYFRLGIRVDGTSLNLRFLACAGEDVTSAELFRSDGDNVMGDAGDQLLWEISGRDLVPLGEGGVVPQVNGTDIGLAPGDSYFVRVGSSRGAAYSFTFSLDDLDPELVFVRGKSRTEDEFTEKAAESC